MIFIRSNVVFFLYLSFLPLLSFSNDFDKWVWKNVEIVGQDKFSREQISRFIPLEIGTPFKDEKDKWNQWCSKAKSSLDLYYIKCSALFFNDFSAYLIVDIVEPQHQNRVNFRVSPTKLTNFVPEEIISIHEELQNRLLDLFQKGVSSGENNDNGFKDYTDPIAHELVLKLQVKVPKYREHILYTLEFDRDEYKRQRAADLLNWTSDHSDTIWRIHRFLNDPSSNVRNDIARYMIPFIKDLTDISKLQQVIDSLVLQLEYPSHMDRNKALFVLWSIADDSIVLHSYIREKGVKAIKRIAEQSLLVNVGVVAKDLAKKIGLSI